MLRGLGIAAGIFILFFAVGFGLLQWRTHEPDFLSQSVRDRVAQSVSAAAASPTTNGAGDSGALDAGGASSTASGTAAGASGADAATQLETFRVGARDSLQIWFAAVMAGGLLAAATWLLAAWLHHSSESVNTSKEMRKAGSWWWGGLLLLLVLGLLSTLYALRARALLELVTSATINGMTLFCAVWAILAYYFACTFGAPVTLRASVPFAIRIVPVRSFKR
jgi:hypothetical protein